MKQLFVVLLAAFCVNNAWAGATASVGQENVLQLGVVLAKLSELNQHLSSIGFVSGNNPKVTLVELELLSAPQPTTANLCRVHYKATYYFMLLLGTGSEPGQEWKVDGVGYLSKDICAGLKLIEN